MPNFDDIMEQHGKKGTRELQAIVQEEMSKMDEALDSMASKDPALKAMQQYMESEGLAFLKQGGKINPDWLAARLGYSVEQVKKAMEVYSQHLKKVFKNAEKRFSGQVPWEKLENLQVRGGLAYGG